MNNQIRDNIEIRLHSDGTIDEVVIYNSYNGSCLFHMEQMSDNNFWMRAYGITQDLIVNINTTIGECNRPKFENGNYIGDEKYEGPKLNATFQWDDSSYESDSKYATLDADRQQEIAEIINKYGVACVLQEITNILKMGCNAEHEQTVIADIDKARVKYLERLQAYWDARIKEQYGSDP